MGSHLSVCGVGISLPDSYGLNATNCTLVAASLLMCKGAYEVSVLYIEMLVWQIRTTSTAFSISFKGLEGFYTTQRLEHTNTHTKMNGQLVPGYNHIVLLAWTRAQQISLISLISLTKTIHLFIISDLLV